MVTRKGFLEGTTRPTEVTCVEHDRL
ncbi:uncharacterized protein METZ01_LOCUS39864 [marine metagenome]|uniref:Uncharacterized protein n=1 Tax=marine metagenome TaxID=408172 RepID=A0A381R634_9ZZZZ